MTAFRSKPVLGSLLNRADPLARGLVAAYLFNEGAGTRANDATGNGNTGTLTNFAMTGSTSNWVGGAFGKCPVLDGTNDYVDCGSSSSLNPTGGLSLSAWVNIVSFTGDNWIVNRDDNVLGRSYTFGFWSGATGKLELQINGAATIRNQGATVAVNTWTHIAATGNPTIGWITYINGVSQGTAAWSAPDSATAATNIGRRTYVGEEGYTEGQIDAVTIHNRALSAHEIRQLYADPFRMWRARRVPVPIRAGTTDAVGAASYAYEANGIGQAITGGVGAASYAYTASGVGGGLRPLRHTGTGRPPNR